MNFFPIKSLEYPQHEQVATGLQTKCYKFPKHPCALAILISMYNCSIVYFFNKMKAPGYEADADMKKCETKTLTNMSCSNPNPCQQV